MQYVFKLPLYAPGEIEKRSNFHVELDPKLNGLTYTEAMAAKVQKAKPDPNTVQRCRSSISVKFHNVKERCYCIDPVTGEKKLAGEEIVAK